MLSSFFAVLIKSKIKSILVFIIENSNVAYMSLKANDPIVTIEFNPRDPSLLIGGLLNGQVCLWDIRTGVTPVTGSHPKYSHR